MRMLDQLSMLFLDSCHCCSPDTCSGAESLRASFPGREGEVSVIKPLGRNDMWS